MLSSKQNTATADTSTQYVFVCNTVVVVAVAEDIFVQLMVSDPVCT